MMDGYIQVKCRLRHKKLRLVRIKIIEDKKNKEKIKSIKNKK